MRKVLFVLLLAFAAPSAAGAGCAKVTSSDATDPPPLKWSDLRYVFDTKEDCNGKEALQA